MDRAIDVILGDILDRHPDLGTQFPVNLRLRRDKETSGGRSCAQDRARDSDLLGVKGDDRAGKVQFGGLFDRRRILILRPQSLNR